jgi:hypothetical protein
VRAHAYSVTHRGGSELIDSDPSFCVQRGYQLSEFWTLIDLEVGHTAAGLPCLDPVSGVLTKEVIHTIE